LRLPASVRKAAGQTAVSASNATLVRSSLDKWAAHYGIDASLARALAWMESGFNNSVVSSVGAQGVMQLLPSTWDYVEQSLIGHAVQHDADGNVIFDIEKTDFGLTLYGRRNGEPDSYYWRITQWLFPWFTLIPPFGDHALGGHAWIPIDDEHCWAWNMNWRPDKPPALRSPGVQLLRGAIELLSILPLLGHLSDH